MEKGETRFLVVHRYDRSSGTRSRIDRVYTDIKIASNTKINHIMVSLTDHYNTIFIDRFLSKTKIGKDSWYFNNPFFCKPEFSLPTKTFNLKLLKFKTFQTFIKTTKRNHSSASYWWENTNSSFEEDARTFSEKFKKILEFQY